MDRRLFETITALIKLRWFRIICLYALSIPIVVLIVRHMQTTYRAEVRIFTEMPGQGSLRDIFPRFEGGQDLPLRALIIQNQQPLLESYPLYEAVQKRLNQKMDKDSKQLLSLTPQLFTKKLTELVFGTDSFKLFRSDELQYLSFSRQITFQPDYRTGTFVVGYTSDDPQYSLTITEFIVDALIDLNTRMEGERSKKLLQYLEEKMAEAKENLRESNSKIDEFSKKHNILDKPQLFLDKKRVTFEENEQEIQSSDRAIADFNIRLLQSKKHIHKLVDELRERYAKVDVPRVQTLLGEISRLQEAIIGFSGGSAAKQTVEDLKKRLSQLYFFLSMHLGTDDRKLLSLETLQASLENALLSFEEDEQQLKFISALREERLKEGERYLEELKKVPELEEELRPLLAVRDQHAQTLDMFVQYYNATITRGQDKFGSLIVLQKPMLDLSVLRSKKFKFLTVACIGAAIAAIVLIVGLDILLQTLISVHQLKDLTLATFLGVFPYLKNPYKGDLFTRMEKNLVVSRLTFKLTRALSRKKQFFGVALLIASTRARAGKSMMAFGAAANLAKMGYSVLFLDADYRRKDRGMARYFGRQNPKVNWATSAYQLMTESKDTPLATKGIVTVTQLFETIVEEEEGMKFVQNDLGGCLQQLKRSFDFIVIDIAPLYFVDSLAAVEAVDAVILSFPEGKATFSEIEEAATIVHNHKQEHCQVFSVLSNSRLQRRVDSGYAEGAYYRYPTLAQSR